MLYKVVSLRELADKESLPFYDEPDTYQEIDIYDDYQKTSKRWGDNVKAKATGYLKLENASVLCNGCIAYKDYIIVSNTPIQPILSNNTYHNIVQSNPTLPNHGLRVREGIVLGA